MARGRRVTRLLEMVDHLEQLPESFAMLAAVQPNSIVTKFCWQLR